MNRFYTGDVPVESKEQLFHEALAAYILGAEFEKIMNGEHSYILDAGLREGYPMMGVRNSFLLMGNAALQEAIAFERCFEFFGCLEEFDEVAENQDLLDKILDMLTEDFLDMLEQQFNPDFTTVIPLAQSKTEIVKNQNSS